MARHTFFSFHYERDVWRSATVRNSWVTRQHGTASGFWDNSLWESVKVQGDAAIKRLIDGALERTSVTVVLIGTHTSERKYVQYEIVKSHERGNGLLGVYIHTLKDKGGVYTAKGKNPFDMLTVGQVSSFL